MTVKELPQNFDELSIDEKIKIALETGNWMLRTSNDGVAYNNFLWNPIGEWTEAPDWNTDPVCGGGLHGSAPEAFGYFSEGNRFELCATKGKRIGIDDNKIKVQYAMILEIPEYPEKYFPLSVGGCLYLSNTPITSLPDGLSVGSLHLSNTPITSLPDGLSVGRSLNLRNTNLKLSDVPEHLRNKVIL